ncbi:MAG: Sir2 family NAD-dependent protein deacetylase [Pseudomonadota bacterium]
MNTDAPVLHVFSGAGLSAESGVPTFRTAGGVWSRHNLDRVCNMLTWRQHRDEVFAFYEGRRAEAASVAPNEAHRRLAAWQARWGPQRVRLLTQNVDDLLERGGAQEVIHLHGDLQHLLCTACEHRWPVEAARYHAQTPCPACEGLNSVKPGVVFFHEAAPAYAHLARMVHTIRAHDILLVVGTALEVVSVAQLVPPHRVGHALNWQVNPEPADPEHFGRIVAAPASVGLADLEPELIERMGLPGMPCV